MLKNKDFVILISNYFAAQISRFSQYTILIWVILEDSDSAFSVAFVGVCAFLPYIAFGTWGGVLADRFKRKHILITTQLFLFCSSCILFFLFYKKGNIPYLIAYLVVFFNGLIYVIEKPSINSAPSTHAVIGRYILPKEIFKILKKQKPGKNNEIHITDAIKTLIYKKNRFIGHIFSGKYLDCGTLNGYIKSSLEISKL